MTNLNKFYTLGAYTLWWDQPKDYKFPSIISNDPLLKQYNGAIVNLGYTAFINLARKIVRAYYQDVLNQSANYNEFIASLVRFNQFIPLLEQTIWKPWSYSKDNEQGILYRDGTHTWKNLKEEAQGYSAELASRGNQIALDAQAKLQAEQATEMNQIELSRKTADEAISQLEMFNNNLRTIAGHEYSNSLSDMDSALKDREAVNRMKYDIDTEFDTNWKLVLNSNDLARVNSLRVVFYDLVKRALITLQRINSGIAVTENKSYGEVVTTNLHTAGYYTSDEKDKLLLTLAQSKVSSSGMSTYVSELKKVLAITDLTQKRKNFETVSRNAIAYMDTQSNAAKASPLFRAQVLEFNKIADQIKMQLGESPSSKSNTGTFLLLAGAAASAYVMFS